MKINACVNVKNWLIKVYAIKDLFSNPSKCECECDKSCNIGEYLDYENCKCRQKLVDKLIEECTGNIEEVKLVETLGKNEHKRSSCTLYIVLFWTFFIFSVINIGIIIYFAYFKYISHNKENLKNDGTHQTAIY